MREHLATLLDDFRRFDRQIAVVRYRGNRRRVTTYAEIARLAGRFAALLEAVGVGNGDRVLLWAENGSEWIAAFYGCMLRGALVVPLDAFGSAEFAQRVAADVRPRLAVGDAMLLRKLNGTALSTEKANCEYPLIAFEDWPGSLPEQEAGAVMGLSPNTPLQILFTSGTTGDPKGIVHTHGNVLASVGPIEKAAQSYLRYERIVHPLRFLHTLPLSHVFGQTMGMWIPPMFAAEVHFENRLVAPRLIETIRQERISVLAAVPRVLALLKTHLEMSRPGLTERLVAAKEMPAWKRWWAFRDVHRAFGLKFWAIISGGGALASPLEQFWNALGFVLVQGYGMTETTALITLNHPFHVAKGSIGKPLPGREVKLAADGEVLVRGPMISGATWSGGALRQRADEWLATGDLAETQATGELRFMGRKSETIVTASGLNIHPEDLEAALDEQPEVAACAVVATDTATGPEPCAVLAMRGGGESEAARAVSGANARLAVFQQMRRWAVWPDPDLPRTSTGKVRRSVVATWLKQMQAGKASIVSADANVSDWLVALIQEIAGETLQGAADDMRLAEDFHLDSLGMVQLTAALEDRLRAPIADGQVDKARTLGDLRRLIAVDAPSSHQQRPGVAPVSEVATPFEIITAESSDAPNGDVGLDSRSAAVETVAAVVKENFIYPYWPWMWPVTWLRTAFIELIAQPLVWLLADPKVVVPQGLKNGEPMLIICNHVTAYDGPLVQFALPGSVRRRMAAAMSGEMLEDFRNLRNPERRSGQRPWMMTGPLAYWLLTALYNVFPLPRRLDFQRSFAHAGRALDRGYNVLVFPEGTRSADGALAQFRPGIGLLTKLSQTAVLPVAILGLGELKAGKRRWFRSGTLEVRVGKPIRFEPEVTEAAITAQLHEAVENLLKGIAQTD